MSLLEQTLANWLHSGTESDDFWAILHQADVAYPVWQDVPTRLRSDGTASPPDVPTDADRQRWRDRLRLLQDTFPAFQAFFQQTWAQSTVPLGLLWHFWLPFGLQIAEMQQSFGRPVVQGILGGQGTGKTTLTQALTLILHQLGLTSIGLSIDDLYKTYTDRQQLQQEDPRLVWRGPPGTHDVDLGISVLDQIVQPTPGQLISLPRFDKSLHGGAGDRIAPEIVPPADVVLFEGWFVGARPIDPQAFETAPDPIRTAGDRQFARDNNQRLRAYEPLWDRLDHLLVLLPEDYRLSKQWRQEAEQRMKAGGKAGMSDAEIAQFVDYFWIALHPELFIEPLAQDPTRTDLVVEIDAQHRPSRMYRPG